MAGLPLRTAIDRCLGELLPHQQANQVRAHLLAHKAFPVRAYLVLAQVSPSYSNQKADSHIILTRLPLSIATSFDLHVLSVPPAYVLSHDQTLKFNNGAH